MRLFTTCLIVLFLNSFLMAQNDLYYYLPKNISFKSEVPTPKEFFGHEIGEWHLSHDKLYFYMLELARVSDRAVWEEYGRSHENRPLGELIISSPQNIKNLEKIRQQNILLCDPEKSANLDITKMPVIIKLGFGIHGNESSSQNASVLAAYYLIAGSGPQIDDILNNSVILLDPSLNPDGMQRHSSWVNSQKSLNNNPDANSWEFNEPWPGGRTNHYWFDLNRDYLLLQHPESTGKVESYFRWRPAIVNDHHEMGAERTFFFQPGIPTRNNPLVPVENLHLTAEIATYHAKNFNEIRSLYYSEEDYDDFYVGKGSSFPDIHGSVGILFEQAGVRGHLREVATGLITFPFAIKNQLTVALSSIEAGLAMREKLLDSQRRFYTEALTEAGKHPVKAYVFSEPDDQTRTAIFLDLLKKQKIQIYKLAKNYSKEGKDFKAGESYIVPLKQNEYRFIRSIFEPVKEFIDSTFYDISTWILPMSFNIPYTDIKSEKEMAGLLGDEIISVDYPKGELRASPDAYAYLFEWNEYFSPKALYILQKAGLTTKVATKEFGFDNNNIRKKFAYGTILVASFNQPMESGQIFSFMKTVAEECSITIYGVSTGLTSEGIDLGSPSFMVLKKPEILMVVGNGMNAGHTGEIWHLLDERFKIPVTRVTADRLGSIDLGRYNVLIMAGSPEISAAGLENIKTWNLKGGIIIGYGAGNNWLSKTKLAEIEYVPSVKTDKKEGKYADRQIDGAVQQVNGAIFDVKLDLTHPVCYGYTRTNIPIMKTGTSVAKINSNIYNNPAKYTDSPLLSGYCSEKNEERIKGNAFISIHGSRIISIYDNTNFRAIWYGANKLFLNSIFFGQIL